jgi:hypothetical protein
MAISKRDRGNVSTPVFLLVARALMEFLAIFRSSDLRATTFLYVLFNPLVLTILESDIFILNLSYLLS